MILGISLGDVTGIGPEVALKAAAAESKADETKYLFIGDEKLVAQLNRKLSLHLPVKRFSDGDTAGKFFVTNPFPENLAEPLPPGSPVAARGAIAFLREGAQRCLRGELDALVTAPVNKEAVVRASQKDF